jgi:hypothetical protein
MCLYVMVSGVIFQILFFPSSLSFFPSFQLCLILRSYTFTFLTSPLFLSHLPPPLSLPSPSPSSSPSSSPRAGAHAAEGVSGRRPPRAGQGFALVTQNEEEVEQLTNENNETGLVWYSFMKLLLMVYQYSFLYIFF